MRKVCASLASRIVFGLQLALFLALFLTLTIFTARGLTGWPSAERRRELVLQQLLALENALRHGRAAERMQAVFPEGACFTCTLHGLAWAELARQSPDDAALGEHARSAIAWTLEQYATPTVSAPFGQTQVKGGVFFSGQRNLVLGRYLELLPPGERPAGLQTEFHTISGELAAAFLAAPTHHLDSYPAMCWPADNVTALASLLLHDRLYGTEHRRAYAAWKTWTLAHPDPATGLPAGRLDCGTGLLLEPARGCANSWILALLHEFDPDYTSAMYPLCQRHFGIRRLGFRMFREYPAGSALQGDVDSGPIVWDAGMVATGVGLGAAAAHGDLSTAADIQALSAMFGWPRAGWNDERRTRQFLWGGLPVGDAFLSWALSLPADESEAASLPGPFGRLLLRRSFFLLMIVTLGLLLLRGYYLFRRRVKPEKAFAQEPAQPLPDRTEAEPPPPE